jgi:hypothetical protein
MRVVPAASLYEIARALADIDGRMASLAANSDPGGELNELALAIRELARCVEALLEHTRDAVPVVHAVGTALPQTPR